MNQENLSECSIAKPGANRQLVDWLERQYDTAQREHSGPEAMAWDGNALDGLGAADTKYEAK